MISIFVMTAVLSLNFQNSVVYATDNEATEEVRASQPAENHMNLNYVYVESFYLKTPGTQNIVVSWGDGTESINDMKLVVEKEDGSKEEWSCSTQAEALYLFSKEFVDEKEQSTYKVVDIKFTQDGEEQLFKLADSDVSVEFGVNKEYDGIEKLVPLNPEQTSSESELETSVVTVDEEDGIKVQDNIETALNEVSDDFKTGARAAIGPEEIVVALDPGHDSRHGGSTSGGLVEQTLTLKIANYAKEELEKYENVKVYMTRTEAACPYPNTETSGRCIEQRALAAAEAGAKIFVSFHLNSGPASANGAEIIVPNNSWKPQVGEEGRALAEKIIEELAAVGLKKRPTPIYSKDTTIDEEYEDGSISDYYSVQIYNKENGIPGIIVEHAFMSNANDVNNFLKTEQGLKKLGVADATGIAKHFNLSKKGTWEKIGDKWKYKVEGKYIVNQWRYIEKNWYYFNASGEMLTGWSLINGTRYYFNNSGEMRTGWGLINDNWYYFDNSGEMRIGWYLVDGNWYYFNNSGEMRTGWELINDNWYYFNTSGEMRIGWGLINNTWYYFNNSGEMWTGWSLIDNTWYYFGSSGAMWKGWGLVDNTWYYFDNSGAMQTGWLELGSKKYYLNESGAMVIGIHEIDGKEYEFSDTGELIVNEEGNGKI